MKRLLLFSVLLLILANIAYATGVVDITAVNSPSGNPGDTLQVNVTVNNADTSSSTISTVNLVSTSLVSGSNTISAPSVPSITNLVNNTPQTVSFSITLPSTPAGAYSGTITATESGVSSNNDTFSYSATVNSIDKLDVTDFDTSNALTITGEEGESVSGSFTIKNTGSTTLSSFSLNTNIDPAFDLNDSDGDSITLTTSFPASLAPGASGTATLTAAIADNLNLDTYGGNVNVTSGSATDSLKLTIRVQPEVCEDGIRKDGQLASPSQANLDIDIREPDNNDEFLPGEEIGIEVKVKNNDNDKLEVVVEAFLYNIDEENELERVKSESIEIDDGDSETFEFTLKVPLEDLDEDDDYVLFVKAFEDGDEDENCNEDSLDIDVEREDHQVIIEKFDITPSLVSCSELVNFNVKVLNIGKRDEDDIFIEVKEPSLGLDERSAEFNLDNGDDAIKRFTFTIPENAAEQDYNIEAVVTFDDGDETNSAFGTLTVKSCREEATVITGGLENAELSINEADILAEKNAFNIPVKARNNADRRTTYSVEVENIDWAEPVSAKTLTLNPGQESTLFIFIKPKEGIIGKQSATIVLKSGSEVIDSQTLTFDLQESKQKLTGLASISGIFEGRGSTVLFVIVDIVLIVFAILLVKMLFIPKKK